MCQRGHLKRMFENIELNENKTSKSVRCAKTGAQRKTLLERTYQMKERSKIDNISFHCGKLEKGAHMKHRAAAAEIVQIKP